MNPRLRAVCDLMVGEIREYAGLHDYDGVVQDMSPSGVARGLAALGAGPVESDPHDEAQLAATEHALRTMYGDLEDHRHNPIAHISNLDLSCYERGYAPAGERAEARRNHLAAWPAAIDGSIESLAVGLVAAPVAKSLLGAAKGLAADVEGDDPATVATLAAHSKLVAHLEDIVEHGPPDPALGADALARLMGDGEAMSVDLDALAAASRRGARPAAGDARRSVWSVRTGATAGRADP